MLEGDDKDLDLYQQACSAFGGLSERKLDYYFEMTIASIKESIRLEHKEKLHKSMASLTLLCIYRNVSLPNFDGLADNGKVQNLPE